MSDDGYYMRRLEQVQADMQCACILINLHLRENLLLATAIVQQGGNTAELKKRVQEREDRLRSRVSHSRDHLMQLQNKVDTTEMQKIKDLEAKMNDHMQWHDEFMNMIEQWHTNNPDSEGLSTLKRHLENQIRVWKQESPSLYVTEEDSLNELRKHSSALYPDMKAHLRASVQYCLGCANQATDLSARLKTMKRAETAVNYRTMLIAMHKETTLDIMTTNPELIIRTIDSIISLNRKLFDWYEMYSECFASFVYYKEFDDRKGLQDINDKMEHEMTKWDQRFPSQRDYNKVLSDVQEDARQIRLLVQSHLRAHMSVAEEYAERGDEETINKRKTLLREQSKALHEQKRKAEKDIADARRAQTNELQKHEIDGLEAIMKEQLQKDDALVEQTMRWYKHDKSREGLATLKAEMEREIAEWDKRGF